MKQTETIFKDDRFRLMVPTLGIREHDGHRVLVDIPSGAVVTVVTNVPDAEGLLRVEWESEVALVFAQDLKERGKVARTARTAGV